MEERINSSIAFNIRRINTKKLLVIFGFLLFLSGLPSVTLASSLTISPSAGTFTVGSTFDVSIFLNTKDQLVNAVNVSLSFPTDKLQIVSPSVGQSIIGIWTTSPTYNNQLGTINFQGVMPRGINVSSGLVSRISFRVKSVGLAMVRFLDNSKVLLHDGAGTDVLEQKVNGIFNLVLPPPAGPLVISETHPDQSLWYANPNISLRWAPNAKVEDYSYVLNENPIDVLDNISEGLKTSVIYKNVADGIYYFHIKAMNNDSWGGNTDFAVRIDTTPPAEFPLEIIPTSRTIRKQPVVQFASTDTGSGISHYELRIIPLKPEKDLADQPIFIEVQSPYIIAPPLELGTYDIIVRAYDLAGNYRESVKRLKIISQIFQIIPGQGLEIRNVWLIPWLWFWSGLALLFVLLGWGSWRVRQWYQRLDLKRTQKKLPSHLQKQFEELKKYQERYKGKMLLFLIFFLLGTIFFPSQQVLAQQVDLTPPLITTISRNISNEEIFYLGGETDNYQVEVIIYVQNLQSGETFSETVTSDKQGDWFYRHNTFLAAGNYRLWVQSKIADQVSPPSPQIEIKVEKTAFQFGVSRISYEIFYQGLIIVLLFPLLGLIGYIIFYGYHGRKKHLQFLKEMREVEESIRRGFAVLRRDIQAELDYERKTRPEKSFTPEEKLREAQTLKDLEEIERSIGKEVLDVWETERQD